MNPGALYLYVFLEIYHAAEQNGKGKALASNKEVDCINKKVFRGMIINNTLCQLIGIAVDFNDNRNSRVVPGTIYPLSGISPVKLMWDIRNQLCANSIKINTIVTFLIVNYPGVTGIG